MVNLVAVKIAEIITNEHTRQLKEMMEKQIKTGKEKVNASGVVVQGGVDIIGKRILNTYKDAINLDDKGFEEKYNSAFERVYRFPNYAEAKAVCDAMFGYFDNVKSKQRPPSGRLVTHMLPPWNCTACFTMARPSPVPPIWRERPLSTR